MTWFRVSGGEMHGAEIKGTVNDDELINDVIELYKDDELIKSTIATVDKTFKFSGIQKAGTYLISTKDTPTAKKTLNVTYKNIVEKEKIEIMLSTLYATVIFEIKKKSFAGQKARLYKEEENYEEFLISEDNTLTVFLNEVGMYKLKFGENFQYEQRVNVTSEDLYENAEKIIEAYPFDMVTWADATEHEIDLMLQAHYDGIINISDYWSVGDIRKVSLGYMASTGVGESHSAQKAELVIIGFDHDNLTRGGKAAVTVQQRDCLIEYGYMEGSSTNAKGWVNCARRTWCNNTYKNALPTALADLIKEVTKRTSAGNKSSTIMASFDNVFLISEVEAFGQVTGSYAGEGTQYEHYKSTSNRYKYKGTSRATNTHWLLRSPRSNDTYYYCAVGSGGNTYATQSDGTMGIAPAFCI